MPTCTIVFCSSTGTLASKIGLDLENGVFSKVHAMGVGIRNHEFFFGELCTKLGADYDFNLLKVNQSILDRQFKTMSPKDKMLS